MGRFHLLVFWYYWIFIYEVFVWFRTNTTGRRVLDLLLPWYRPLNNFHLILNQFFLVKFILFNIIISYFRFTNSVTQWLRNCIMLNFSLFKHLIIVIILQKWVVKFTIFFYLSIRMIPGLKRKDLFVFELFCGCFGSLICIFIILFARFLIIILQFNKLFTNAKVYVYLGCAVVV